MYLTYTSLKVFGQTLKMKRTLSLQFIQIFVMWRDSFHSLFFHIQLKRFHLRSGAIIAKVNAKVKSLKCVHEQLFSKYILILYTL